MKNTLFRRVVSSALVLALSATMCVPAFAESEGDNDVAVNNQGLSVIKDINAEMVDASNRENAYTNYVKRHKDDPRPDCEFTIAGKDYVSAGDGAEVEVTTVDGKDNVLKWSNQEGSVSYEVDVPETGVYNIEMGYEALAGRTTEIEFGLLIDDVCPYTTASRISLSKRWVNKTGDKGILQDTRGNDMRPGQVEEVCWQVSPLKDVDGLFNEPLGFYIEKGKHTITLKSQKAQFAIDYIKFYQYKAPEKYVAPSESDLKQATGQIIKLEAEMADYKSDRTLFPTADRNSSVTSSVNGTSASKTRYNTIGKDGGWGLATQTITYKVNVEKDGYYKIGIRGRQDTMRGMYSNRRLYIDGVVPNLEANQIKFYYDTEWSVTVPKTADGEIMYFYLSKGEHEIAFEAVPGEIGEIMGELDEVVYNINSYYRRIRQITGPDPDEYNNYMIDKAIPTIVDDFKAYSKRLGEIEGQIEKLSGTGGTEAVALNKMAIILDKCTSKPDRIPEMMTQLKDNVTSLSAWVSQYREQPLEMDIIELATADQEFSSAESTFFESLSFSFNAFIGSFFEDYNNLTEENEKAMICWTMLGRDNAIAVQTLISNDYNVNAKTPVNLQLVTGGVLEATFAGKGPDLGLFIGGDFPIQLAARGVLTDVSQYDDFDEIKKRFAKDATVLYEYNGGVYGLPIEQTFPMLFYRSDILNQYGIDPAVDFSTWDRLIRTLPTLQRNYMEVGLILPVLLSMGGQTYVSPITEAGNTFAMLLLQQGLNYYDEGQTQTTFHTQEAINAFDMWTKFYTTYSFQQQYDAFTRFRTGDMPVLIQNYQFFNQLTVAAPEIKGCWNFQPVPGTLQEDGTINHAANSQGSGAIIFKKAFDQEGAWDFAKWFTSKETQVEYGNDIESILGKMGRFSTANVEALDELSWTNTEVALLKEQFNSQVEIPIIPASYGVTRNIMNAFRTVVNDYENSRDTLFWYNKDINEEITRKRDDLGLNKNDE
ncbi:MAG: extracellular solute-binding protein [Ruminococcus sp.]|nr:extracellular solute-binding protein [Ruminococcus sp.]